MTLNRQAIRQQFDREMKKARERITTTPSGEIGWLVQFIQRDLDALTPSVWMVLAYEVASFAEADGPDRHALPIASASGWTVQAIPGEMLEYTLPSRKEAMQLQRTIRDHLEQLWQHAVAPVTFSDLTLVVTMPGALHGRHGSLLVTTTPKTKEFEYRVAVSLAHHAGRIRPCQECKRIFLAARRDQLFCDPRCQMRVASRKWRKGRGMDQPTNGKSGFNKVKTRPQTRRGGLHGKTTR
ncbi:MAG TPA: hypothetical protein VJT11_08885 [Nitrospiraceae bacterium]|nr:hypothetical protein [Nitrospiraceae bacterium]